MIKKIRLRALIFQPLHNKVKSVLGINESYSMVKKTKAGFCQKFKSCHRPYMWYIFGKPWVQGTLWLYRIRTIWFSYNKEWGSQRLWEVREVSIAIKEGGAGLQEFSSYWEIYFEEHFLLIINPIKGLGSKAVWKFFAKLYNLVGEGYPMCAKKDPK